MKKKRISLVMALVLVLTCVIGGTIAWLTHTTESVTNTFTVGDINITLAETTGTEYKMIPGTTLPKNPKVTVEAGSEACYLFVKVDESENLEDFITYTIDNEWSILDGQVGVYYREVAATTANIDFPVLSNNQVEVLEDVKKSDLDALTPDTYPTLTFTAYAVQKANIDTAADAWDKVK